MTRATDKPDIKRLIEFHELLLKFQAVYRVTHVPPTNKAETFRQENDVEHSYNLAMTAWLLCGYFPKLDRDLVLRYALVHDLVEVHAGDTYVYASKADLRSKQAREQHALDQLQQDWPDFPELTETIKSYEKKHDEEAKFIYALDKIMPIMLIFIGKGHTWQREGITPELLDSVKRHKVAVSPEIALYYDELYELLVKHRHYFTGSAKGL